MQKQFIHQSDLAGTGGQVGRNSPAIECRRGRRLLLSYPFAAAKCASACGLGRKVLVVDVFDDVPRFELLRHGKLSGVYLQAFIATLQKISLQCRLNTGSVWVDLSLSARADCRF